MRAALRKMFPVYPGLAIFSVPKVVSLQLQFKNIFVLVVTKAVLIYSRVTTVQLKEVRHVNDVLSCCQPWSQRANILWCFQLLVCKSRKYMTLKMFSSNFSLPSVCF